LSPFRSPFFTGTLVFDVLGVLYGNSSFRRTAGYLELAGLVTAGLAAIPGLVDYFFTVPPASSAKKRATLARADQLAADRGICRGLPA
jgi:uncharacterized membrane protein